MAVNVDQSGKDKSAAIIYRLVRSAIPAPATMNDRVALENDIAIVAVSMATGFYVPNYRPVDVLEMGNAPRHQSSLLSSGELANARQSAVRQEMFTLSPIDGNDCLASFESLAEKL